MATTTPLDPDTDTNTNTDPNPPSLPTLRFYGTTPFYTAATGGHLAVNPAADLTVTAGHADTALYLWRSGDKMVLNKYTEKGPIAVRAVRWRADGRCFSSFFPCQRTCGSAVLLGESRVWG